MFSETNPIHLLLVFFIILPNNLYAQVAKEHSSFKKLNTSALINEAALATFQQLVEENQANLTVEQQIELNKKGLETAGKLSLDTLALLFTEQLTLHYYTLGDDKNELKYWEKQLQYGLLVDDTTSILNCQFNIGSIYLDLGKYAQGIDILLAAIETVSKSENKAFTKIEFYSYVNLGNLAFLLLGEHEESIKYLRKAEPYFIQAKEYDLLTKIYIGIASNFQKLENKDSVEFYMNKTVNLVNEKITESQHQEDKYLFENFKYDYASIVEHYLDSNELDSAKVYRDKLRELNFSDIPYQYILDLKYYLLQNDLTKVELLLTAIPDDFSPQNYRDFLELQAKYFEKIGDYQQALQITKKLKTEEIKNLASQKVKWSDFTDGQVRGIALEKDVQDLEVERSYQKRLLYFSYGIAILFLLLLLIAWFAYKQIQKNLADTKLLERQSKQLQVAEQEKNRLFINIAHEFQTPLSIISGLSQQLGQSERLTNSEMEQLKMITKNSKELSETTHQVLELSKATTVSPKVVENYFYLEELMQYLLSEFHFIASINQVDIKYDLPDKNKYLIASDVEKLSVVLKNILANAIKYTGMDGAVQVTILEQEASLYKIVIKDTGIGIAKEELTLIFDRYFQATSSDIKGGIGIGLAVCKDYIKLLNGKIEVQSIVEVGSEFIITLPKSFAGAAINPPPTDEAIYRFPIKPVPAKTTKEEVVIKKDLQLLIVEDNLDFCAYLSSLLQTDYQLTFVHNGQHAIQYLEKTIPDLIISDWMMPNMDGVALVAHLKSKAEFKFIPILLLTARSLLSDQLKAIRIGVDDYLTKPFEETMLKARIQYLLRQTIEEEGAEIISTEETVSFKRTLPQVSPEEEEWLLHLEQQVLPVLSDFDLNMESVAASMHISLKQLHRKLKGIIGLTPKKYVQELRLWEARRLLELKELHTVKAVSFSVGFKDVKNFSRRFKERFGKNPSAVLRE